MTPLDVLGRMSATLNGLAGFPSPRGAGNRVKTIRDRDWGLQLFPMKEEFPVSASHQLALIKSLPFVHIARRYHRLNDLVRSSDWRSWTGHLLSRKWEWAQSALTRRKDVQT